MLYIILIFISVVALVQWFIIIRMENEITRLNDKIKALKKQLDKYDDDF